METNPLKRESAQPRKGFTLIELLVVISIIAMLIAILLPALKGARDSARSVQCLSNQRQIATAFANYLVDHNTYPMGEWNIDLNTQRTWDELLGSYDGRQLTDAQIETVVFEPFNAPGEVFDMSTHAMYQCPLSTAEISEFRAPLSYAISAGHSNGYQADLRSRGVTRLAIVNSGGSPSPRAGWSIKADHIKQPSGSITMFDWAPDDFSVLGGRGSEWDLADIVNLSGPMGGSWIGTHFPTIESAWPHGLYRKNFLFADGHAGTLSIEDTVDDSVGSAVWSGGIATYGVDNGYWDAQR